MRFAEPTRSIWTETPGTMSSRMGISMVWVPFAIRSLRVSTIPERRSVITASAGEKGSWASTRAVSPALYSFLSGTRVTASCSSRRFSGRFSPATQSVNWLWFFLFFSSEMTARSRYDPPGSPAKRAATAFFAEVMFFRAAISSFCSHAPFSWTHRCRIQRSSKARPSMSLPSMSVTIASISSGFPSSTKVFSLRSPT